jgi:thiol-disulfide isomerase/thioredoxin
MDALIHAPEFPKQFQWLNTAEPLSLGGKLRGQVVLLDFWTYCCINCMHVLADLEHLEEVFAGEPFVVVGVHSAKYDNERDLSNIRAAVFRHKVRHPVLVDEGHRVWSEYDVNAWPTLVLVGADGRILGGVSGEGHRELLEKTIRRALAEGRKASTLAAGPLEIQREVEPASASGLAFPGKVIADAAGGRLFIVDSNHHRIVVTRYPDAEGRAAVIEVIGSGERGSADGRYEEARFFRPQGAVLGGNALWVADTENHLVRRVDLEKRVVTTVLGTGRQVFDPEAGKTGREQGLNSPWDVALGNNRLYIAQAGQHQIFAMNLMTGMTEVAAGSGRENIRDGKAHVANLAQPSGVVFDAKRGVLFFADSEVSAVRRLDVKSGEVFTLVGVDLFEFGDADGEAAVARLQHPLGVALSADGAGLLVADTYNHKIKRMDLASGRVGTVAGTGKAGNGMGEFYEPGNLAVAGIAGGEEVFVADTNNHRIMRGIAGTARWQEVVLDWGRR